LAPLSTRLVNPRLVRPPLPLTTPPRVRSALPLNSRSPPRLTALVSATAVLASRVVPAAAVKAPVPSAVLEPTISVPAFSVVPPEKVLLPLRVRFAVPFLIRLPAPLMTPLRPSA